MVTGASEGQEGCPQAGLLEQGCRLKEPTAPSCQLPPNWAPAPAWKGRKPLIPLENPPGGALVPPLSTVSHGHAHTCSRHIHSLSVLSPLPAAVCSTIPVAACAAVSMPPVLSAPWSHVFTCAHTCIGAVSATSLRLHANSTCVCPHSPRYARPPTHPHHRPCGQH